MRVLLADLESFDGYVSKDTVHGGYGSRLRSFSRTAGIYGRLKRAYNEMPSVQLAYVAAICARAGHEVRFTRGPLLDADVVVVLSSLVDHRHETAWADRARDRGARVGFVGLAASKLPDLFADHADFVITGEPEAAIERLAGGERLTAVCDSPPVMDLDSLPFPRWDLVTMPRRLAVRLSVRPPGGGFPLLASRSCPGFCTYCPHRILAPYRARSVANVVAEVEHLARQYRRPYIVFRDPLFTEDRDRCLALCDAIAARAPGVRFECETRLDRLDEPLLGRLHAAGLRAVSFGVESASGETLRTVGRRTGRRDHESTMLAECRRLGVVTCGLFILGFPDDDWESAAATIHRAIELGPTFAQFKLLTPLPGTPLRTQLEALVVERDWEKFDGFTPTFRHPTLDRRDLLFLLGAAYSRFYFRPSYLANLVSLRSPLMWRAVNWLDARVAMVHARREIAEMSRAVAG